MNTPESLRRLADRSPLPLGVVGVLVVGTIGTLRLVDVAVLGGPGTPVLSFLLLSGAGLYVAVLVGLVRGFAWGWYGTIVVQMLWTLEAAVRYDVVAVALYYATLVYLYDHADRYVDLEEYSLFRASA